MLNAQSVMAIFLGDSFAVCSDGYLFAVMALQCTVTAFFLQRRTFLYTKEKVVITIKIIMHTQV